MPPPTKRQKANRATQLIRWAGCRSSEVQTELSALEPPVELDSHPNPHLSNKTDTDTDTDPNQVVPLVSVGTQYHSDEVIDLRALAGLAPLRKRRQPLSHLHDDGEVDPDFQPSPAKRLCIDQKENQVAVRPMACKSVVHSCPSNRGNQRV